MKGLAALIGMLLFAANASGEECTSRSEEFQGRAVTFQTCSGRVDEVVKVDDDGFVQINYIVQYKGQRLVVEDPLSRYNFAVGDTICFMVNKWDSPPDDRARGFRVLHAIAFERKAGKSDCTP